MLLIDVNVLLAAHRDDHPLHGAMRPWFDALISGDDPFTVPVTVWASFLRLATNRRIFEVPTPLADAFAFVEATSAQPHHQLLGPGPRHLGLLRRCCEGSDAVGDLVPDAVLAAIAIEHACEIVTLDRDFARFPTARHRRPGSPPAGPNA